MRFYCVVSQKRKEDSQKRLYWTYCSVALPLLYFAYDFRIYVCNGRQNDEFIGAILLLKHNLAPYFFHFSWLYFPFIFRYNNNNNNETSQIVVFVSNSQRIYRAHFRNSFLSVAKHWPDRSHSRSALCTCQLLCVCIVALSQCNIKCSNILSREVEK